MLQKAEKLEVKSSFQSSAHLPSLHLKPLKKLGIRTVAKNSPSKGVERNDKNIISPASSLVAKKNTESKLKYPLKKSVMDPNKVSMSSF